MTTLRTALFAAIATLPQVEGYAPDPALVGQGRSRSPESTVTMPAIGGHDRPEYPCPTTQRLISLTVGAQRIEDVNVGEVFLIVSDDGATVRCCHGGNDGL